MMALCQTYAMTGDVRGGMAIHLQTRLFSSVSAGGRRRDERTEAQKEWYLADIVVQNPDLYH